jgi:hypothetical protein
MENLGIFYDHLVYFTAIGNIFFHLVYFMVIWYIFPRFGILYQEESGNPGPKINSCHLWWLREVFLINSAWKNLLPHHTLAEFFWWKLMSKLDRGKRALPSELCFMYLLRICWTTNCRTTKCRNFCCNHQNVDISLPNHCLTKYRIIFIIT